MANCGARVHFESVGCSFQTADRRLHVLDDVSLEIAPGASLAIVGPSGSGKSTILNIMMGRVRPTSGQVQIKAASDRPARLSVVFQEPTLLPWLTAAENVRLPLELERRGDGADARVRDMLARVGLADFLDFKPAQLSGGMQSRVALARALVTEPDLLLLDEPFASLDEATSEDVMVDLARLGEASGATLVLVTHSLLQAAFLADRVLLLGARPGRVRDVCDVGGPRPRSRDYLDDAGLRDAVGALRLKLREAVHAGAH